MDPHRPAPALQREDGHDSLGRERGRRAGADDDELTAKLEGFEHLDPAKRLERLAENEIITLLQLQRFDPETPEWITLARALVEYGYAVFRAWVGTGVVRAMAAKHGGGRGVIGLGKIPEGLRLDDDDGHALVVELITTSVESFRTRTLMNPATTWRPTGGASLKTYFIGRCLMEFPDTYVRWQQAERAHSTGALLDDGRHVDDPADHAVAAVRVDELLNPVTRAMFELQQSGYKLQEIAELLTQAGYPHSEASVRTVMTRARAQARAR